MINFMRYKYLYFLLSSLIIVPGILAMIFWGFKLSIDFTGGTVLELRFKQKIPVERYDEIKKVLSESNFSTNSIQATGENTYLFKFQPITKDDAPTIKASLAERLNEMPEELRFETVGPLLGRELLTKTIVGVVLSALFILGFIAWAFKVLRFGVCAILAMFHDSLVLLGSFALLGHFFGAELDILFVTAMLTILSFSVHDTVVVYDRIRETVKKMPGASFTETANVAVTETMTRSLNNSLTVIFMLLALFLLGGTTIKWFVVALLIGMTTGAYSSPFVAVPLLVVWDQIAKKIKSRH